MTPIVAGATSLRTVERARRRERDGDRDGRGEFAASNASELVLGRASLDDTDASGASGASGGSGGNDCMVGGGGADKLDGGPGTEVCIGTTQTRTYAHCETNYP
ncbi:MAG: hypothetical protein O3B31_07565 [Chloroflexi bacterium]|nr:hypothetical protein [Chloroflexota bacterium]